MDTKSKNYWIAIVAVASALKLLLIPAYRSTDFEVHRNWLAITNSLPIHRWYYESTSEWTLDYPPLFAWFEWLLSQPAKLIDPAMLVVTNQNYASRACVVFQRVSVIVTDLVLAYGTRIYCGTLGGPKAISLMALIILNGGLLMVDHIHFQYNGILLGILLLSISRLKQDRPLESAFWFALLLNMKHIFLYVAPAYFVYLFRSYCFRDSKKQTTWLPHLSTFAPFRLAKLGLIVLGIFTVSFGPFIVMGQMSQVMSRLFPFKRGLTHAYWAPNFWALYNFADKLLFMAVTRYRPDLLPNGTFHVSTTGGLVGDVEHFVLPSVPPIATLILTVMSILPALAVSWRRPGSFDAFLRCLIACAFGSFLFGWHVHEKAVLLVIIPMSLLAVENARDARHFIMTSTTGIVSLFPLLFHPAETPIKFGLCLAYYLFARLSLPTLFRDVGESVKDDILTAWQRLYVYGLAVLQCFCSLVYPNTPLQARLPFLPLMAVSVYCAVGIVITWTLFHLDLFRAQFSREKIQ